MWRSGTKIIFILSCVLGFISNAQNEQPADTVTYVPESHGLRVGIDLASLIRTAVDDEYSGFQLLADYKVKNNWYAAVELGSESLDRSSDQIDFNTDGRYIKLGADVNFHNNWIGMDNMIYAGLRVGHSRFEQQLTRFDIRTDNSYFPVTSRSDERAFTGLSATWIEIQAGMKVQLIKNVYAVLNLQVRRTVQQEIPDNFDNLFIPGFGRTYDTGEIGVGYTYGILYRIPLFTY